jgi:hypothetical protein
MTNQLNKASLIVFEQGQQDLMGSDKPTRPGDEPVENRLVYETPCGLRLVETAEDEEHEF